MSKFIGNQLREFYSHLSTKKRLKAVRADLKRVRRNAKHCQLFRAAGTDVLQKGECLGGAFSWSLTPEGREYWAVRADSLW